MCDNAWVGPNDFGKRVACHIQYIQKNLLPITQKQVAGYINKAT